MSLTRYEPKPIGLGTWGLKKRREEGEEDQRGWWTHHTVQTTHEVKVVESDENPNLDCRLFRHLWAVFW